MLITSKSSGTGSDDIDDNRKCSNPKRRKALAACVCVVLGLAVLVAIVVVMLWPGNSSDDCSSDEYWSQVNVGSISWHINISTRYVSRSITHISNYLISQILD